ncbi:MAG: pyruvate kinase [Vicinamibacterales bacterium]
MRRTKIIATVGPASDSDHVLDELISAGTDIVRLNFSHGTHATHEQLYHRVRAAAARAGREVAILQDLAGPKIRTGRLDGGRPLDLRAGDRLRIVTGDGIGRPGIVFTSFEGLARDVRPGDRLLLADGQLELRVEETDGVAIGTVVVEGGTLGEHKGINAPGVTLACESLTPKDLEDLEFGLELGVDMVALSFVRSAHDIRRAKQRLADLGRAELPIVAKIERPQALADLTSIVVECDAIMVARGDLGLEMPLEQVPGAQKRITLEARRHKTPVIVATQVLESMTEGSRPTRAEVNDAASAVADGADAIMLAGETAIGAFPSLAVKTLSAIIVAAEENPAMWPAHVEPAKEEVSHAQALCEAAVTVAERSDAQAIVAVTRWGLTARRLSALRSRMPVFAATDQAETARRLAIYWGVSPVQAEMGPTVDGVAVGRQLVERAMVQAGAAVVLVSLSEDLSRTDANYVKIQRY